ncbi:hypothetical protein [Bacillus phage vB_BanS-Thrax4]|nr:hypothetical protein [Bacillus phage vB_BanS-Thrax4]
MKGMATMKIQLPDGKQKTLDENITLEEKKKIVEDLTEKWMYVLRLNWHSNSVKYFLDSLANYLVWHKEEDQKGTEDKEILSRKKLEKMSKMKKTSKQINFSDLSKEQHELLFGERGAE